MAHQKKFTQGIHVRHVLIFPFVLLAVLGITVIAWLSVEAGRSAVRNLLDKLGQVSAREILAKVSDYMEIPLAINFQNEQNIASGLVSLQDPVQRNRYFAGQLLAYPLASYSFVGLENADFYGARRNEAGAVELIANNAGTGGASWYYAMSENRDALEKVVEIPNFDCRTRPWYKSAKAERRSLYSPIYRHFVYKDLAITAARPLLGKDGSFLGVFGVDFRLDSINDFLGSLPLFSTGSTFIVERSTGMLIGNSLKAPNYRNAADGSLERLGPGDLDQPLFAQAYSHFVKNGLSPGTTVSLQGPNGLVQLNMAEFSLANLDWVVFMLIPEIEFMGPVLNNVFTTLALVLVLLLGAVLVGIWVSRILFNPLEELVKAAGELEAGNLEYQAELGEFVEWASLSRAFNTMAKRLSSTINMQEAIIVQRTAELAQKNKELSEANASKDRFFSLVAHDLRGPIGSLAYLLDALSHQNSGAEPQKHAVSMEQAAGYTRGIHEFLETLLTWAMSQQGTLECKPQNISMDALQSGIESLFSHTARLKGLSLRFEASGANVHADPDMVKTVLRNLVSNAVKFTPEGGVITVRHHVRGDCLEVEVQDSGMGMEPETLASLFSLDKKQSRPGTAGEKGNGLGLVLCKDFVERNGGSLGIQSQEGKGSTVLFTLPLARE